MARNGYAPREVASDPVLSSTVFYFVGREKSQRDVGAVGPSTNPAP
jgi:hypothetical protein